MKKAIAIIVLGLLLPSTGNALSQDQAINKYLSDRPLANIEGIFKSINILQFKTPKFWNFI
jgi:hypothetical protein